MRVFHVLVLINLFNFGVVLTKDYPNHIKENHKAEIQVKILGQFSILKKDSCHIVTADMFSLGSRKNSPFCPDFQNVRLQAYQTYKRIL